MILLILAGRVVCIFTHHPQQTYLQSHPNEAVNVGGDTSNCRPTASSTRSNMSKEPVKRPFSISEIVVLLVKCNFLLTVRDEDNRNIFRYSETSYLKSYRNVEKVKKVKDALIEEKKSLENVLERRKTEKVFIENIITKNPDLQSFFDKYENVISKELKELEDKNSFIVNIFNDIENDQLESF